MKFFPFSVAMLLLIIINVSCSADEITNEEINLNQPDNTQTNIQDQGTQSTSPEIGDYLIGLPKSMEQYEFGALKYWAIYEYDEEKKLKIVKYGYGHSSEIFSDTYYYNSDGNLVKLHVGNNDYPYDIYNFYWENDRIIKADRYNAPWSGNSIIYYEYGTNGTITSKTETNIDFNYGGRSVYSYDHSGNLISIQNSYLDDLTSNYEIYSITKFNDYTTNINLFPELEIIPGQITQFLFPGSEEYQHLLSSGYNTASTYKYQLDDFGRVIKKTHNHHVVLYAYY